MVSSILQVSDTDRSDRFVGLSAQERRLLRDWRAAAWAVGVDAIEDLASRPWPYPMSGIVIGVFEAGVESASWLVIGHNGSWAVASCAEGSVSPPFHSLAEALAVIHAVQPGSAGSA